MGHTGTLDPLATGLLVLLVGQATRMAQFLAADEKTYIADVRLGVSTPTYDAASLPPDVRYPISHVRYPTGSDIEAALARFRGSFLQAPPPFSAKKIASVPAYEKARKNQPVDLKPVPVTVHELELLGAPEIGDRPSHIGSGLLRVRVAASAGFYVRSLAHDLGQALGCGAHLEALRRTRVGRFGVEQGLTLDRVEAEGAAAIIPPSELLADMPAVRLTVEGARRTAHGNALAPTHVLTIPEPGGERLFRLLDADGTLRAVAQRRADGLLHPLVVLG